MSARGRGYGQDWDPMREDFDNSGYDPQYPDDSSSGLVSLDHTRLYVTNIPKGLSDEGVFAAFSKYGRTTELFVSQNPEKRFGLITYETPGEAKLAMMKLNRTEPLGLNVRVAHKRKPNNESNRVSRPSDRDTRACRDDAGSVGSRSNHRRPQDLANGDNMEDLLDDGVGLNNSLDAGTNLELEHLKLEQLKLQEAQLLCKQRMFLLKQAEKKSTSTSRRVLPNGQIFVCNNDRADTGRDTEASFVAGAGDSLKIPALQRVGKCVACGERADAFCAGCGVTPYCSAACQRRDWRDRHRQVCHNLKRTSGAAFNVSRVEPESEPEPALPAAAPLRRPRSPEAARERRNDDSGSDRAPPRIFGPPGAQASVSTTQPTRGSYRNARGPSRPNHQERADWPTNDRSDDRSRRPDRGANDVASDDRPGQGDRKQERAAYDNKRADRPDNRRFQNGDRRNENRGDRRPTEDAGKSNGMRDEKEDDDRNAKPEPKPQGAPLKIPTLRPKTPLLQAAENELPAKAPELVEEPPQEAIPAAVTQDLVPKNSLVDLLAVSDVFSLSVGAAALECRDEAGFVCVALHENYSDQYMSLLDDAFTARQVASEPCQPAPGDTFSFLNPEDGCWYRARCLAPALAALLDCASKLVELTPASSCRKLSAQDCAVPEFCCLLTEAQAQIGANLNATVVSKAGGVLTLSLSLLETGGALGGGRVRRWLPRVDRPELPAAANVPVVPRPPVANKSKVLIVDATKPSRVLVRPAASEKQRRFDDVITEAVLRGAEATPLEEPPVRGQTVLAKFEDGNHYRALCRRVNSKLNKYLLEYIDYGNESVAFLEALYPCPPELTLENCPTLASVVTLPIARDEFTPAALEYINKFKDECVELTVTIPSGEPSAASGAAVRLSTASGQDVTRAVDDLCTPEWRKLLDRGGDVLEFETLYLKDLEFVDLPATGGELEVVDTSSLQVGVLSGHERGSPHAARALALSRQIAEYANSPLCRDPYLPKIEELCITQCPTTNQWVRAALLQQESGAGGADVTLLALDRGCLLLTSSAALRRAPPEFVRAAPVAVCSIEIRDFPREPTAEQLARARSHMRVDDEGRGALRYIRAVKQDNGDYVVDAPALVRAMSG